MYHVLKHLNKGYVPHKVSEQDIRGLLLGPNSVNDSFHSKQFILCYKWNEKNHVFGRVGMDIIAH